MLNALTGELLDLTATVKGRRKALFAMVQSSCSCCCCCGSRGGDEDW